MHPIALSGMCDDLLFVLRLWNGGADEQDWRASITNLRTKESVKFADLGTLVVYLTQIPAVKARAIHEHPRDEA